METLQRNSQEWISTLGMGFLAKVVLFKRKFESKNIQNGFEKIPLNENIHHTPFPDPYPIHFNIYVLQYSKS